MSTFPIQTSDRESDFPPQLDSIPWELIAPHEEQAKRNHGGQNLQRLAERHGLSACEAVAVIEDKPFEVRWKEGFQGKPWRRCQIEAIKRLDELCANFALPTVQQVQAVIAENQPGNWAGSEEWHVYEINDYEWWMARSLDEAKKAVTEIYGEDACDEDAHKLDESDLERLKFCVDGNHSGPTISFREELRNRISAGPKVQMFATTEF